MKSNFLKSVILGLFILTLFGITPVTASAGNDPGNDTGRSSTTNPSCDPSKVYWAERLAVQYAIEAGYQVNSINQVSDGTNNAIMTTTCGTRILVIIGNDGSFVGMEILPN